MPKQDTIQEHESSPGAEISNLKRIRHSRDDPSKLARQKLRAGSFVPTFGFLGTDQRAGGCGRRSLVTNITDTT